MLKIKVPATTANLGPGFDTLGLALDLFQEIAVEKAIPYERNIEWRGEKLVDDHDNFVINAIEEVLKRYNSSHLGYHLIMLKSDIPISRGLGSSAAAIVAGIYAANYLLDDILSVDEILDIANEMEGHPDNVAPAILGNLILATSVNNRTHYSKIEFPDDLKLKVLVPDFRLSTTIARNALPDVYDRQTCIYNMSRISFLIHALMSRDYSNLGIALSDMIHQPYRFPLIGDSQALLDKVAQTKAYGMFISGAGPTLIAVVDKDDQSFDDLVELDGSCFNHQWTLSTLTVNRTGTICEPISEAI